MREPTEADWLEGRDPWSERDALMEHTDRMDQAALDDDRDLDYLRGRYPNAGRPCDHDYPDTQVQVGEALLPACDGCGVARIFLPPSA